MKYLVAGVMSLAIAGCIEGAAADPWKDKSGKGPWRSGYEQYDNYYGRGWVEGHKEKFRTANGCEVERKWKKGGYEEKVKCKGK